MILACPNCQATLTRHNRHWSCDSGHLFDIAKEGYLNLLVATKGQSKVAGDSAEMIQARRTIHNAGLYEPLAAALCDIIQDHSPSAVKVLDVGCGEGYYSRYFQDRMPAKQYYGIDISKAAIKTAAKQSTDIQYVVASAFRLPIRTKSVALVSRIFAPSDDAEIERILTSGGYYLEVGPSAAHLIELKAALYDSPKLHAAHRTSIQGFDLVERGQCQYPCVLSNDLLTALVNATPFAYKGHREKRAKLLTQSEIEITMAFEWRLFNKTD